MASHFEDLLSCGVCLDIYDHPKRLRDCSHVFCLKCLEALVDEDNVISCPECRVKTTVLAGSVTEGLHTDFKLKEMVDSFLCVDCKTIDRFAKECDECHVKSCHLCICSHESAEKCALLGSIRNLKSSLPAAGMLQERRNDWVAFKEKNLEQKKKVDQDVTELIKALQEKKKALLEKFDALDKNADAHITQVNETTKLNESLQKMMNELTNMTVEALNDAQNSLKKNKEHVVQMKQMLVDIPPDALGTIYTGNFKQEMDNMCIHITGWQTVNDQKREVILSVEDAQVRTRDARGWPMSIVTIGKLQISRHKGGSYDISVTDKGNNVTKWEWNNRDPTLPHLQCADWWYHVPWTLKDADDEVVDYTARIEDNEKRQMFASVMEQLTDRCDV